MLLGIQLASFIPAAIRVSFENMSMKENLDLQDSSLFTLGSEKYRKALFFGKCKGNRVLCVKTWVVSFVLMRTHNQIRFLWGSNAYF